MESIRRLATLAVPLVTLVLFATLAHPPGAMTAPASASATASQATAPAEPPLCSRWLCE